MAVSVLPALLIMPAMAGNPNTSTENPAWVFGDIVVADAPVRYAAFGGRRMEWNAAGTKYRNDFPNYSLVGQSVSLLNSDTYVGPVTLTLRELNGGDVFAYNYQWEIDGDTTNGNEDVDLANWANIGWNEDYATVLSKLSSEDVIGELNASYTAGGVYMFAQKDDGTNAGKMLFDNTTAMVDGATLNAKNISITNGSALTFVKQDSSKLTDFDGGTIDSNGVTNLNAETIVADASALSVNNGATLNIDATNTTIKNITSDYGALTAVSGSVNINGENLVFNNNKSTSHGAGFYYKDQTAGANGTGAVFAANNITFSNNEVLSSATSGSGAAVFVAGGNVSFLGNNNTFTNNVMNATIADGRKYKVGGGAIANQSYWKENNHSVPVDAVMVIGKNDGSSVNTFAENESSTNGGAVMNRAIETDGNAVLTINGTTEFSQNIANMNGGAIYNVARDGRIATINMNNGSYTFADNTATNNGGAIYNEGIMNIVNATFTDNKSTNGLGGAIYNTGDITFGGDVVFSGNTDTTGTNDIYNDGTITFNGNANVVGGITGNSGDLIIGNDGVLTLNSANVNQNTITNNGQLNLNSATSSDVTNFGTITLNDASVSSIASSGKIVLAGTTDTIGSVVANNGNAGELQIDTSFDVNDGFDWQVASITNNGLLNVNSANINEYIESIANNNTGTLNISALKDGVALSNAGTLNVLNSINTGNSVLGGDVNVKAGTLTSSLNGESLNVYENASAVLAGAILNGDFVNNGNVTANGAVSVFGNATNNNDITFNNTFAGNLVNNSSLVFNGSGNASQGTVVNNNTVILNGANVSEIKNSGTVFINGDGTTQSKTSVVANGIENGDLQITESGVLSISNGFNWDINSIKNSGTLNISSKIDNDISLTNNSKGILNLQNGVNLNQVIANSGTVVISGNGTTYTKTSVVNNNGSRGGLKIANGGKFSIGNDFAWEVANITNEGELTLNSTNLSQAIANSGTIIISGEGTTYANTSVGTNNGVKGNLRIAQNGKFDIGSGFAWAVKSIDNKGELNISALGNGISLTNSGTLNVSGGSILMNKWTAGDVSVTAGKLTATANASSGRNLTVAEGAEIALADTTLTKNIANEGKITSLGDVSVGGDITNNGTLSVAGDMYAEDGVVSNTANLTVGGLLTATSLNNTGTATLGALYGELVNNGTITFNNGESVFAQGITGAGNMNIKDNASVYIGGDFAGAIANDAELTFDGDTTISKNITGNGVLTVAEGSTLNIGTLSVTQDEIVLDGNMFATLRKGVAQINAASSFTGDGKLNLTMLNPGSYHVFGDKTFSNIDWDDCEGCISKTNPVYDLVWDGGDVIATLKSIDDIANQNNLKDETAHLISGLMQSPSKKANVLIERIQEELVLQHKDAVEDAVKTIHPEKESVVQSVSTSIQNTVNSLAAGRMMMPSVGRNGGDYKKAEGGFWMQGIFNKSKNAENFNGHTTGFGIGLDQTYKKTWMFGVGYANSVSKITASDRDMDVDTSSVFVYGQYKKHNWFTNAVVNYAVSGYEEHGEALGLGVLANYDVKSFGTNVKVGYETKSGFTPEIGLRYMHTSSDEYWNNLGIRIKSNDSDYLTSSIGSRYVFAFQANEKLILRPELRASLKYDIVSDDSVSTVTIPGLNGYTLNGNRLSKFGGEFGIGIGTVYKGMDFSLNYDIEAREDYTSQSGMLRFRYNF